MTRLIRVSDEAYSLLKSEAEKNNLTIKDIADQAILSYFNKNISKRNDLTMLEEKVKMLELELQKIKNALIKKLGLTLFT